MAESKFEGFLEEEGVQHAPIKDRVDALEGLKDRDSERAEELIREGLNSDSYTEKEVAGTVEIKQGKNRGEQALKELVYDEFPAHEYEVDDKQYSARDPTHRRNVVKQLSRHGDDVIEEMRKVLEEDRDNYTLEIAIQNLKDNGTDKDRELLERFLNREVDEKTKRKARDAMKDIEDVSRSQEGKNDHNIHKEEKLFWRRLLEKLRGKFR